MSLKPERNTLKEDLCRDYHTLKSLSWSDRFLFIYDYYKWYLLLFVFILITIFTLGKMIYEGQRFCRLRVCVVLNAETDLSQPWFDRFTDELSSDGAPGYIDINHDQPFDYDNQYYSVQELEVMTTISSGRMDVAICNEDMYSYLLALNACAPLNEYLPADLFEDLSKKGILPSDTAGLQIQSDGSLDSTNAVDGFFGIRMDETVFAQTYDTTEESAPLYVAIIRDTDHTDDSVALIRAITQ